MRDINFCFHCHVRFWFHIQFDVILYLRLQIFAGDVITLQAHFADYSENGSQTQPPVKRIQRHPPRFELDTFRFGNGWIILKFV